MLYEMPARKNWLKYSMNRNLNVMKDVQISETAALEHANMIVVGSLFGNGSMKKIKIN